MKKYIIILFLLISSMTFSQIKMSGKVTDTLGTPLDMTFPIFLYLTIVSKNVLNYDK